MGTGGAFAGGFKYCILRYLSLTEASKFVDVVGTLVLARKRIISLIMRKEIDMY